MTGHVFVIKGDIRRFACDAYLHAPDRDLRANGSWTQSAPDAASRLGHDLEPAFRAEQRFTLPLLDRPGKENEPTTVLTAVPYDGMREATGVIPRLESSSA